MTPPIPILSTHWFVYSAYSAVPCRWPRYAAHAVIEALNSVAELPMAHQFELGQNLPAE